MYNIPFSLTQLNYVVALEKHRHFGKAAKACFVTQPSLSMQVQKLEEDLGVLLFDRSKQPIELTDIGKIVLKQARMILLECQNLHELVTHAGKAVAGNLRLGIIPTIAPSLTPRFLGEFLSTYADVSLEIEEMPTLTLLKKLESGEIDAGILSTPVPLGKLSSTPLYYEPFVLCLPRNHRLTHKSPLSLQDVPAEEMLLLDHSNCFREQIEEVCPAFHKKVESTAPMQRVRFEAGQLETLRQMVEKGLGITLLPRLMLTDDELANGTTELVYRLFSGNAPQREISLVSGGSWLKKPIISAMTQCIVQSVPRNHRKRSEKIPLALFSLAKLGH